MDVCCLLGICCPPVERREKVVAYYLGKGASSYLADVLADDLLARVDAFLDTGIGALLKQVAEHGKGHHP